MELVSPSPIASITPPDSLTSKPYFWPSHSAFPYSRAYCLDFYSLTVDLDNRFTALTQVKYPTLSGLLSLQSVRSC